MSIVGHLVQGKDRPPDHPVLVEDAAPFVPGAGRQYRIDRLHQFGHAPVAVLGCAEPLVVQPVFPAERPAQALPGARVQHVEHHPLVVLARIAVRHGCELFLAGAAAHRRLVHRRDGEVGRLGPDGRFVERRLDHLPFAGSLRQAQGAEDCGGERQARRMIALGRARHGNDAVLAFAHRVVQPRTAEEGSDIVTGTPGIGAGRAVAGQGGVHQPGAQLEQRAGVEPESLLSFRQQVAEKDIGALDETVHHRDTLGFVQVHGDGTLAAVVHVELEIVAPEFGFDLERPAQAPHRVALERFDFHHPRAHVGKHRRGARRGHVTVDLDHGDIVQGSVHRNTASLLGVG